MSYTLSKLKQAKAAAERGDKETTISLLDHLIDRMELLLRTRKAWRPTCRKDHDDGGNIGIQQG